MNWLQQKTEKIKQAWKQYLVMRRQKCLFPYGHDMEREKPYKFMMGTGKYIKDEQIMEERDNWWYKCKRCGKMEYWW